MKNEGLHRKYEIRHTDGSPVDPNGQYFVLKLNSADPAHREACRAALQTYAEKIKDVLPQLAKDLFVLLDDEESRKKTIHAEIEYYEKHPIKLEK